jgi:hypothetical protein
VPTINDTVLELAALKAFADHVKAATERAKDTLTDQLHRGTISAFVEGEEPTDVGTIVVVPDRPGWGVVDEAAFLAWVKVNRPTAIVESVRSSDKASILEAIGKDKTGEVPDGVARVKATGYVQVKQTVKQRDALLEAAGDGRLPAMPILQIGAGQP